MQCQARAATLQHPLASGLHNDSVCKNSIFGITYMCIVGFCSERETQQDFCALLILAGNAEEIERRENLAHSTDPLKFNARCVLYLIVICILNC
jgi:hypothetical protein